MKNTLLLFGLLAFLTFKNQAQTTVTDIDGNVYNTVTIGTQVWMKENLKTTKYSDGTAIPNVTNYSTWSNLSTGAYCDYNNAYYFSTIYGKLYNWFAVIDTNKICPTGWHVPSDVEWTQLTTYLGGEFVAGGELKEIGTTHWHTPNTGATDETGFTALPGGSRDIYGTFDDMGDYGVWWSTTQYDGINAWKWSMLYNYKFCSKSYSTMTNGFSIRCINDSIVTQIHDNNIDKNIQIYPNPSTDRVYIDCAERQNIKMQVYNIIGECVFESVLTSGTNEIDISSLTTGIYVIKLTGTDGTYEQKLIKN